MKYKLTNRQLHLLLALCLAISFLLIFHQALENFLSHYLVRSILSQLSKDYLTDAAVLTGTLVLLVRFYSLARYERLSKNITFLLIGICLYYSVYRFFYPVWQFTRFSIYSSIAYWDTVYIICLERILLHFKKTKSSSTRFHNKFQTDDPLGEDGTDLLGYTDYAVSVTNKINESCFEKSFAIGINAAWGVGKTSFMDLTKRALSNDTIIIDFRPWNSSHPDTIITDFFETFHEAIKPYHVNLHLLLSQYSRKLTQLNPNGISRFFETIVILAYGETSLQKLHNQINNSLKQLKKKIVIYIDDVDRLDKNEIMEVLRIIRNTASFYNTVFIVAYDRNYIIESIEKHNLVAPKKFLEKIFQLEVNLPSFSKDFLRQQLIENLSDKLPDYNGLHDRLKEVIEKKGYAFSDSAYLDKYLMNMRDVTRLTNSISMNMDNLVGEVAFADFLRIELLRLHYPAIYNLLSQRPKDFLEVDQKSHIQSYFFLKNPEMNPSMRGYKQSSLFKYLIDFKKSFKLSETEIGDIVNFIDDIFKTSNLYTALYPSQLSIIYPWNFDKYFSYNLQVGMLSEVAFESSRKSDTHQFHSDIKNWVEQGLEIAVARKFKNTFNFYSREDFQKIIQGIFYLASLPSKTNRYQETVYYEHFDLINKLKDYQGRTSQDFYNNNSAEYRDFVESLFNNATIPFLFEATLAQFIAEADSEWIPLDQEELLNKRYSYLKTYLESVESPPDQNAWKLYYSCFSKRRTDTEGLIYKKIEAKHGKVIQLMRKFIVEKGFYGFVKQSLFKDRDDHGDVKFYLSKEVTKLFGSYDQFEKELNRQLQKSSKEKLTEFNNFFMNYKKANFQPVHYNFKKIHF